ncbi:MAG: putative DNA binding domain-containing protein, partial [Desulfuromusa sp.]|nr:putative DNA binding domain-containing protein [Desulfuromusa sp.]
KQGEGRQVEFKTCRDALNRDVYETVCAFLNRSGGDLLLGVTDAGQVMAENSNRPHGHGLIEPDNFSLFPKNPVIARFFRQIGRADELGSGVRKLFKYCRTYGGSNPELLEADIFRFVLPLANSVEVQKTPVETPGKTSEKIVRILAENPDLTLAEVAEVIGKSLSAVERASVKLTKEGRLIHIGSKKGGRWEVLS